MLPGLKSIGSFLLVFLGGWIVLRYLMPLFFPFLLGAGLALLAEPVVRLLRRYFRLPRGLAAGIGVGAAFSAVTVLVLVFLAFLIRELSVLAGILPDLTETTRSGLTLLQTWLLNLAERTPKSIRPLLEKQVTELFSGGNALLDKGFRYLLGLAGDILTHVPDSALTLGTAVISGFMISAKLPEIRKWIRKKLPGEKLRPLVRMLAGIRQAVGGWLTAQLKLAAVTMGLLAAGLLILRIPHALLWALGISFLDAFPVLGTGTVLLPWSVICFLQGDNARGLGLLGVYAAISLIRSVLEPRLVGRQLGLDPLVTLFSLYSGYRLWGIGGMILAPLLAVTAVQTFRGNSAK